MPGSSTQWSSPAPYTDGQMIVGLEAVRDIAGVATLAFAGGVLTLNSAASTSPNLVATLDIFTRTGFQTNHQEAFGTAALQPGPNSATTNGPLGVTGVPPNLRSTLSTLVGPTRGFPKKGIQLNSLTISYKIAGAALTSFAAGIYANQMVTGQAAPNQTVLLASANNGLGLAVSANIQVTTIALPTPAMLQTANQVVELNILPVVAAGGTLTIYGISLNCSYNLA